MNKEADIQSSIEKLKIEIDNISNVTSESRQQYRDLLTEKNETSMEKEVLMLQLQQLQEELEVYFLQSEKHKSELEKLTTKIDSAACKNTLKLMQLSEKFAKMSKQTT